jgi:hypothetical protein
VCVKYYLLTWDLFGWSVCCTASRKKFERKNSLKTFRWLVFLSFFTHLAVSRSHLTVSKEKSYDRTADICLDFGQQSASETDRDPRVKPRHSRSECVHAVVRYCVVTWSPTSSTLWMQYLLYDIEIKNFNYHWKVSKSKHFFHHFYEQFFVCIFWFCFSFAYFWLLDSFILDVLNECVYI